MSSYCIEFSFVKLVSFSLPAARKNFHRFESKEDENKALIYNYSPVYTGTTGPFVQTYFFWCCFTSTCWFAALIMNWHFKKSFCLFIFLMLYICLICTCSWNTGNNRFILMNIVAMQNKKIHGLRNCCCVCSCFVKHFLQKFPF